MKLLKPFRCKHSDKTLCRGFMNTLFITIRSQAITQAIAEKHMQLNYILHIRMPMVVLLKHWPPPYNGSGSLWAAHNLVGTECQAVCHHTAAWSINLFSSENADV